MSTWRRALLTLAVLAAAPAAWAQESAGPAPHSLDGLEDLAGTIRPGRPRVLGIFTGGVTAPLHRDLHAGGEGMLRAGYHIGANFYLGGGFGLVGTPADAMPALPKGTLFQFQGLLGLDWILPLRPLADPHGAGPSFRLGLAPGFVGGVLQQSRSDKQDLKDRDLAADVQLLGGIVRFEAAFDFPIYQGLHQRLFFTVGAAYQWGLAEARLKLRDKTGATQSLHQKDRLRLDAVSVFIGLTSRF